MKRFHRPRLAAALLLGSIGFAAPAALAQDSTMQDAQREAVEGIGKLLEALQMFVKSVPQYSAPEVLPNGDIIIRRIHPDKDDQPEPIPKDDGPDSTST